MLTNNIIGKMLKFLAKEYCRYKLNRVSHNLQCKIRQSTHRRTTYPEFDPTWSSNSWTRLWIMNTTCDVLEKLVLTTEREETYSSTSYMHMSGAGGTFEYLANCDLNGIHILIIYIIPLLCQSINFDLVNQANILIVNWMLTSANCRYWDIDFQACLW